MTSTTIPAWVVALLMLYTGWIWLVSRKHKIRMDSRIFATSFILWGIIYGVLFQFFSIDVESRGFLSRLMVVMVCISQSFPLTISYLRSRSRGE